MADKKERKSSELDEILSEINDNINIKDKNEGSRLTPVDTDEEKRKKLHKAEKQLENQLQFAHTSKVIENAMDEPELTAHVSNGKHIEVTVGHEVTDDENQEDEEDKAKKKMSKAALKKANGTAISREPVSKRQKITRRQKVAAVLGALITIFVVIGVVTAFTGAVGLVSNLTNATYLKKELVNVIYPLTIIDTPEFENPTQLDNSAIISSSIWAFVIDDIDKSKYRMDDLGAMYVPDVDIETYIRKLFGSEVAINHQSVLDASVSMAHSPESKTYIIESTPRFLPYTPRIDKITRVDDIYTLRVSYILPSVIWNIDASESNQVVDKIMEYTLKKNENGVYNVVSVSLLEITLANKTESDTQLDAQTTIPSEELMLPIEGAESEIASDTASGEDTPTDASSEASNDTSSEE